MKKCLFVLVFMLCSVQFFFAQEIKAIIFNPYSMYSVSFSVDSEEPVYLLSPSSRIELDLPPGNHVLLIHEVQMLTKVNPRKSVYEEVGPSSLERLPSYVYIEEKQSLICIELSVSLQAIFKATIEFKQASKDADYVRSKYKLTEVIRNNESETKPSCFFASISYIPAGRIELASHAQSNLEGTSNYSILDIFYPLGIEFGYRWWPFDTKSISAELRCSWITFMTNGEMLAGFYGSLTDMGMFSFGAGFLSRLYAGNFEVSNYSTSYPYWFIPAFFINTELPVFSSKNLVVSLVLKNIIISNATEVEDWTVFVQFLHNTKLLFGVQMEF